MSRKNGNGKDAQTVNVPHSVETEEALLGTIIIDSAALLDVLPFLEPADFFIVRNQWVYDAMLAIHRRGGVIDYVSVVAELKEQGRLEEVGGASYLTGLINRVPALSALLSCETYGQIVHRAALRRRLLNAASEVARLAYDHNQDVNAVLDESEALIAQVRGGRADSGVKSMKELSAELFDDVEARQAEAKAGGKGLSGLPTGFRDLDRTMGGMQRSDLIILAGRTGMGKTGFALTVTKNVAQAGARVLVFTLEMSGMQLVARLNSMMSRVPTQKMRNGTLSEAEFKQFVDVIDLESRWPISIDDTPNITPEQLRAKAMRKYQEDGLDLIVVDYLQLMIAGGRRENRVQEVSEISRSLKVLAREINVPVLALAQLNRGVEYRQDKRPMLADLRESGSIEQDADIVLMLYRDEVYNENTAHVNQADVIIAKHRHGPTGTVPLFFRKETTEFANIKRMPVDLAAL